MEPLPAAGAPPSEGRRQARRSSRSGDPRKRDARKRLARDVRGSTVPRIWTRPLRELTPDVLDDRGDVVEPATSLGFDVIEWARESLLIDLLPWQEWLLVHALELLPTGRLRFRNIVLLVARQNGKSTLSQVLSLYFLCVLGRRTVLTTAQDLDTAEEIWQGAVDLMLEVDSDTEEPIRPDVFGLVRHVSMVNGKKALILTSGERYKVKAANRRAGRGLTGDLVVLDELREHQSWDAWGAITKTTQARPDAQVWALSNAGDITSVVLRHLRMKAHAALGDPDGINAEASAAASAPSEVDVEAVNEALRRGEVGELNSWLDGDEDWDFAETDLDDLEVDAETLGIFEWSAAPGSGLYDVDAWAQANPAMNYVRGDTSLTSGNLKSSADGDPEWVFRTENMCQWPDGAITGLFDPGRWEERQNKPLVLPSGIEVVRQADKIVGSSWLGIDQSQDASWAYVARVGRSADGRWQGEVVAAQRGTDWLKPWLLQRVDQIVAVTAQGRGAPISGWLNDVTKDPELARVRFVRWEGADLIPGHQAGFAAVRDGLLWHNRQPALDLAAERAKGNELAGGRVIDRLKSPVDVAPLVALFGAWWLSQRPSRKAPPPPAPGFVKSGDSSASVLPDFLKLEPGLAV